MSESAENSPVEPVESWPGRVQAMAYARTRRLRHPNPRVLMTLAALLTFVLLMAMAAVPQLFTGVSPYATNPGIRLSPPGPFGVLGTDYVGRDLYARAVFGVRYSVLPPLAVVAVAGTFGSIGGLLAGYVGGWIGEALMRISDVFLTVPALILAMAVVVALGPSQLHAALAVAIVWWPGYARLSRAETLVIKEAEYVQAARALGASPTRLMLRHILPNVASSLVVKSSLDVGTVLLILSGLGFLGIGAQPPTPEWGAEVSTAAQHMFDFPLYVVVPGTALFLAVFSVNVLGDGIREALDPRLAEA